MGLRIESEGMTFLESRNYDRARIFIGQYKVALSNSHLFRRALRDIDPDLTPQKYFQAGKKADSVFPVSFSTPSSSYEFLYVPGEEHEVLWIKKSSKDGSDQRIMVFAGKPEYDGAEAVNEGQIALSVPVVDRTSEGKLRLRRHSYHYNNLKAVVATQTVLNEIAPKVYVKQSKISS
jgi:hypothetical protein